MNELSPLPARLETTRQVVLLANRIGVHGTKAIVDAGLGELSPNPQIVVLNHLVRNGPTRPRDLLGVTRRTRGGLSNLLDRLEAGGYISRTYGTVPGDRRGATVVLTDTGRAAATTIEGLVGRTLETLNDVVVELAAALDSITEHDRGRSNTTRVGSLGPAGLLSLAGAAMSRALHDVDPDDPTPHATALTLCCAAPPGHTRPKELIEVTALSSGGVSQLLDRLEDAGLVLRRAGQPPDRRAVTVTLTDEGRQELERRLDAIADHLALLRSAVPNQDG